jgi:hypothetical protein
VIAFGNALDLVVMKRGWSGSNEQRSGESVDLRAGCLRPCHSAPTPAAAADARGQLYLIYSDVDDPVVLNQLRAVYGRSMRG